MLNGIIINEEKANEYRRLGYWGDDTLLTCWNNSVNRYQNKEFVVDDRGARFTYGQIDAKANALSNHLLKIGIKEGDVVTLQITPRSEFVIALIACIKIGAIAAPIGLCFVNEELVGILKKLQSKIHICTSTYRDQDRSEMVLQIKNLVSDLSSLIFIGDSSKALANDHSFTYSYEEIISAEATAPAMPQAKSDDIALVLCTSGTTMGAKCVMFTHNNLIFSEKAFNEFYELSSEDTIFMPSPLNHAIGLHHGIISPMLCGGRVVFQEKFSCKRAVEIMNNEKCTYSMGATPFIYDLLKQLEESGALLPHLRFYICGGAPVSDQLVCKAYEKYNILVCESYGSTESVPHVGVKPTKCLENAGKWSGEPLPGIEVRIVDKERKPVAPGVIGEEASRGPNVFVGYANEPELTHRSIDADGWFYSGDLALADENGNIKIVGRIKDIIIRGGENLNSNAINNYLEGCPGVKDHAVVGLPDERLGERICAFIVLSDKEKLVTKDDIVAYLEQNKVQKRFWPEHIEIIDAIERTESGKIKKGLLSAELKKRMEAKEVNYD